MNLQETLKATTGIGRNGIASTEDRQTEGGKFQNICEVNSLSKFFKCYFFENKNSTRPPSRALYSVASRGSDSNNTTSVHLNVAI